MVLQKKKNHFYEICVEIRKIIFSYLNIYKFRKNRKIIFSYLNINKFRKNGSSKKKEPFLRNLC